MHKLIKHASLRFGISNSVSWIRPYGCLSATSPVYPKVGGSVIPQVGEWGVRIQANNGQILNTITSERQPYDPVLNAAMVLTRTKSELLLENMFLRQQLIVLKRQTKRPALTWRDRPLFVLLAGRLRTWKQALVIV
jgi:hypothetical protein